MVDAEVKIYKVKLTFRRIIVYTVLILLTLLCIIPFYILLVNATRAHTEIQKGFSLILGNSFLSNLRNLLQDENLPVMRGIFNSLFISTCCAVLTTYFSAMTAYAIYAYEFKFKKAIFIFILLIMMVPTQVSTLGFINMMSKFKLMDSYIPLIVPSIAAPIVFFFIKQYMESNLPLEIIEAARVDGSGELGTFNKIIIPIIKPALAVQGIFSFVNAWNNYFLPSLIIKSNTKKTIPILIAQLRSADFLKFDMGKVYMLIAVAILPITIVYLILSRYIVAGITAGSVKG